MAKITYRLIYNCDADREDGQRQHWTASMPGGDDITFYIDGPRARGRWKKPATVNWCGWGDQPVETAAAFAQALATMARKAARLDGQRR